MGQIHLVISNCSSRMHALGRAHGSQDDPEAMFKPHLHTKL
jgi:hypothetical protein